MALPPLIYLAGSISVADKSRGISAYSILEEGDQGLVERHWGAGKKFHGASAVGQGLLRLFEELNLRDFDDCKIGIVSNYDLDGNLTAGQNRLLKAKRKSALADRMKLTNIWHACAEQEGPLAGRLDFQLFVNLRKTRVESIAKSYARNHADSHPASESWVEDQNGFEWLDTFIATAKRSD